MSILVIIYDACFTFLMWQMILSCLMGQMIVCIDICLLIEETVLISYCFLVISLTFHTTILLKRVRAAFEDIPFQQRPNLYNNKPSCQLLSMKNIVNRDFIHGVR
jgi:hypothetical protein